MTKLEQNFHLIPVALAIFISMFLSSTMLACAIGAGCGALSLWIKDALK